MSTEGGDIPTDIYGESLSGKCFETLTVRPKKKKEEQPVQGQMTLFDVFSGQTSESQTSDAPAEATVTDNSADQPKTSGEQANQQEPIMHNGQQPVTGEPTPAQSAAAAANAQESTISSVSSVDSSIQESQPKVSEEEDLFDREAVMKFINDGHYSFHMKSTERSNLPILILS